MKIVERVPRQKRVQKAVSEIEPAVQTEHARVVVAVFVIAAVFMSASQGMLTPVFAHLLKETSSGVRTLGFMTMVPQMALLVLSPFIGGLEDRYGRYPFLLLGFAGLVVTNLSYLFAHSAVAYTGVRLAQTIVCVGIIPATMGMLADVVPEHQRTRRISLLLAGHAGGMTLGPVIGGFLLQRWGAPALFGISALLNLLVLCFVGTMLPRILPTRMPHQKAPRRQVFTRKRNERLNLSLLWFGSFLMGLLVLDFVSACARTFVEPQQALYLYKVLKFTPVQFGLLMSSHGLAMLLAQVLLSCWGDRLRQRVVIAGGILSHACFLVSLLFLHQFAALFLISLLAGMGGGMVRPLLSACYLESTAPQHRSSRIGMKEAVSAFGEIAGSLAIVLASPWLLPQETFLLGGGLIVGASLLAFFLLQSERTALASSPALPSGLFLVDQPTLPLSRIRLADQPTLPLSRVRLADQPTLPLRRRPVAGQQAQLPGLSLPGNGEAAWLMQHAQRGIPTGQSLEKEQDVCRRVF